MQPRRNQFVGKITAVVVAVLVAAAGISMAAPVTAATDTGTVTDTAPTATVAVSSCQTIESPGFYELTSNVTNASPDGCFDVEASNVVLHGNGNVVATENATGAAVTATDVDDVSVDGFELVGWQTGVEFESVDRGAVVENTIEDVGVVGVSLDATSRVSVTRNTVANGTAGVTVEGEGERNLVVNNRFATLSGTAVSVTAAETDVAGNDIVDAGGGAVRVTDTESVLVAANNITDGIGGVSVAESGDVTVRGNDLRDVAGSGILVAGDASEPQLYEPRWGPGQYGVGFQYFVPQPVTDQTASPGPTHVLNNTVADTNGHGIALNDTVDVSVANNDVTRNRDGIRLHLTSAATVTGNAVTDSRDDGVALANATDNTVTGNELLENGDDGIYVVGSNNTVTNNTANRNVDDGLDVQNADGATVRENVFRENGDDGVFFRNVANATVIENVARDNVDDGIDLRGSVGNVVRDNDVCLNDHHRVVEREGSQDNDVGPNRC